MKIRELFDVISNPDRIRIIRDGTILYSGYLGMIVHADDLEAEIMRSDVKRLEAVAEIRHKEWKERGLIPPMRPEDTPQYMFQDLQMELYCDIYI